MTATLRRLVAFAGVPVRQVALSAALGVLAVAFAVALMTTAGYLISRAAEQPPILSLTVTIVFVRFFGLARPLTRYLDRVVSHDVALGVLGRIRTRFYERIEPLAPGQLEGYRRGELLGRMVGDVDALQGLYVRGLSPPFVALVVGGGLRDRDGGVPAGGRGRPGGRACAGRRARARARGKAEPGGRAPPGSRTRRADRRARRAAPGRSGARRLRP